MGEATFYFNPACSKCRTVSGILAERGVEAEVVEYLDAPPDRAALERLLGLLGTDDAAAILRREEPLFSELGLEGGGRDAVLDAIAAHPELCSGPSWWWATGRSWPARPSGCSRSWAERRPQLPVAAS